MDHIRRPHRIEFPNWNYAILAIAFVSEGTALHISLRKFRKLQGRLSVWKAIRESKDPSTFTVIFEDTAALVGLSAALIGIFLSRVLHVPELDGAASVLIGFILVLVSLLLVVKSKTLLVGEGADRRVLRSIRNIALIDEAVERTGYPLTMYFGPHNILLTMNVQFRRELSGASIEQSVDRIESAIRKDHPDIQHIYLEADAVRTMGRSGEPVFPKVKEFHPGSG